MENNDTLVKAIAAITEKRRQYNNALGTILGSLDNAKEKFRAIQTALDKSEDAALKKNLKPTEVADAFEDLTNAIESARHRTSREKVTVAVAGLARQGKSRLLQSLSGLGQNLIPTGNTGNCTAVRSVLRYGEQQEIQLTYHTQPTFLKDVIKPYYDTLWGGAGIPSTLADFVSQPLKAPPENANPGEATTYRRLTNIHSKLKTKNLNWFQGGSEIILDSDITKYVTYPDSDLAADSESAYLRIKEAHLSSPQFFSKSPNVQMIDLAGLNDLAQGVREKMTDSLREDADVVLLIRSANPQGGGWDENDTMALNLFHDATEALPLKHWCIIVMNHVRDPNNEKQLDAMIKGVAQIDTRAAKLVKCDCSDSDEVTATLVPAVNNLLGAEVTHVDKMRIDAVIEKQKKLEEIVHNFVKVLDKNVETSAPSIDGEDPVFQDGGEFKKNFNELRLKMRQLIRDERKQDKDDSNEELEIRKQTESIIDEIKNEFDELLESPEDVKEQKAEDLYLLPPSKLKTRIGEGGDRGGALGIAILTTRIALSKILREKMDKILGFEMKKLIGKVEEILKGNDLGNIFQKKEGSFFECLSKELSEQQPESELSVAFQSLLDFRKNFNYDFFFLPAIRTALETLDYDFLTDIEDPNDNRKNLTHFEPKPGSSFEEQAKRIFDIVTSEVLSILHNIESDQSIYGHLRGIQLAELNEFIDNAFRSQNAEKEWRSFFREHKQKIWPKLYENVQKQTKQRDEWKSAIARLENAIEESVKGTAAIQNI